MLCAVMVYVKRVRVWGEVRFYSLICFIKERLRTRLEVLMSVSRETDMRIAGQFAQPFPLTTLKVFGVGNDLSYSATANAWNEQRRETLRNTIKNVWRYRVAWVFVSET